MTRQSYLTIQTSLDATVKRERKFFVQSLVGEEGICRDFHYVLQLSSLEKLSDQEIGGLMGRAVTVTIGYPDAKNEIKHRYINGIVYDLEECGLSRSPLLPDIWQYRIEIGSWFKKLDYINDCRIFQKNGNTSIQLIADLLREYGCHDFRSELGRVFPRKDYVVLYNEAVSRFILRLLREDSIIWRFEHFKNNHILVFSDDTSAFPEISGSALDKRGSVKRFCRSESHLPLKALTEASYAWENQAVQAVRHSVRTEDGRYDPYLYTGAYNSRDEGEGKTVRQCRALERLKQRYQGESTSRALCAGSIFSLHAPPLPDQHGRPFLIETLTIEATNRKYLNRFTVVRSDQPYCPLRNPIDDQPRMMGPQTAFVVGAGESGSVQVDRLGRIKVRFHWDHTSPADSGHTSACLRVAMPAAGIERGFLFNPRVGEEVVVDFEDGNPDKPVIIGSVYSKNNPPPFAPNLEPYRSIIKNSPQANANQVVFDDSPQQEQLEIVAKKEMNIDVNRNVKIDVEGDMKVTCKSQWITAREEVTIHAGHDIQNMSLATLLSFALLMNNNTAGGNILNLAAGLVTQAAGGVLSNLAGLLVANTSVMGITQAAEGKVTNESKLLLLNTAANVVNAGDETVDQKAALAILNSAGTELVNKGKSLQHKTTLFSTTETAKHTVTGNTTIGP